MAPPATQGMALSSWCWVGQVGSYTCPRARHVWAAGNRIEDGASVFQMPSALQNRFVHLSVEATFDSFRQWALGHGIHERIVAFLAFRPQLLHKRDAAHAGVALAARLGGGEHALWSRPHDRARRG
jgi:hypothetical protein